MSSTDVVYAVVKSWNDRGNPCPPTPNDPALFDCRDPVRCGDTGPALCEAHVDCWDSELVGVFADIARAKTYVAQVTGKTLTWSADCHHGVRNPQSQWHNPTRPSDAVDWRWEASTRDADDSFFTLWEIRPERLDGLPVLVHPDLFRMYESWLDSVGE